MMPIKFVEEWDLNERRKEAQEILNIITENGFAYGAFCKEKLIGYIVVSKEFFGSSHQYIDLHMYYVSEPYRGRGIGKELFRLACGMAKEIGAKKFYISAHSSKESQAVYRKLGCVEAMEINQAMAENEPCDVQMEFTL